jgi:hypothetical protein
MSKSRDGIYLATLVSVDQGGTRIPSIASRVTATWCGAKHWTPVKKSAMLRRWLVETMPLVNTPVRRSSSGALQLQHTYAGVVIVKHLALSRLQDQLIDRFRM